jgi:hypothetical protein
MTIWSEGAAKSMTLISHLILIRTVLSVLKYAWNVSISWRLRHAGLRRRLGETHTMYAAQLSVCGSTEWWPDTTENIEFDVWEMQLTKIEQYKRAGSHMFVSCGLLVVPVDTQRDIWRRVGLYRSEIHIRMMIYVPFPILLRL